MRVVVKQVLEERGNGEVYEGILDSRGNAGGLNLTHSASYCFPFIFRKRNPLLKGESPTKSRLEIRHYFNKSYYCSIRFSDRSFNSGGPLI
jgi:hypothetical protein